MAVFIALKPVGLSVVHLVNVDHIQHIRPLGAKSVRIFWGTALAGEESGSYIDSDDYGHTLEVVVEMLRQAQVEVLPIGHHELPDNLTCPTCDGIIHIVDVVVDPSDIDASSGTGLRITFACEDCGDPERKKANIEMLFGDHSGCMPFHFGPIAP
jgi:hypothetical protein